MPIKFPEKCSEQSYLVQTDAFCMVHGDTYQQSIRRIQCQNHPLTTALSALRLLFRDLGRSTALGPGGLGLLGLLFLLLGLRFLDGCSSLSGPYLGTLVPLRKDGSHISTNDATLVLHSLSGPLLRNFFGDALLVEASVGYGP